MAALRPSPGGAGHVAVQHRPHDRARPLPGRRTSEAARRTFRPRPADDRGVAPRRSLARARGRRFGAHRRRARGARVARRVRPRRLRPISRSRPRLRPARRNRSRGPPSTTSTARCPLRVSRPRIPSVRPPSPARRPTQRAIPARPPSPSLCRTPLGLRRRFRHRSLQRRPVPPAGAAVSYTATANDLIAGGVAVTCGPASGSTFPVAVTTVNCSATDGANTSAGSFTVTVTNSAPTITVPGAADGRGIRRGRLQRQLRPRADEANDRSGRLFPFRLARVPRGRNSRSGRRP